LGDNDGVDKECFLSAKLKAFFRKLLQLEDTPERIARGVALGTLIGMTPTVGIQMTLAVLFAAICRANRLAAVALVWLSNPVTIVPIYWFDYWFGGLILTPFTDIKPLTWADIERALSVKSSGFFGTLWGFVKGLGQITAQAYPVMFLGGFVSGVLLGIFAYFLTLRAVRRYRQQKERKREQRSNASPEEGAEVLPPGSEEGGGC